MTAGVLALIAVGALTHAAWNLAIKRGQVGGVAFVWLTAIAATVVLIPFAVTGMILHPPDAAAVLAVGAVSAALHTGYFLLLQKGYAVGDVSVVYPLARGTGPLLAVIFAVLLLAERPSILGLTGAAVVITGVLVIGTSGGRLGRLDARAGVAFGLLTGVMIAAYTVWDAFAVTMLTIAPVVVIAASSLGQSVLLAPLALRQRGRAVATWRRNWREVLIVGILSPLSYIAILIAMQFAPVSLVAPAREVSVVLVSLAGWLFFREPHPAQRLLGAAVVLTGVAMLTGG